MTWRMSAPKAMLPPHVRLAYDGLEILVDGGAP